MRKKIIYLVPAAICVVLMLFAGYHYFFAPLNVSDDTFYVYIDGDDNVDSVTTKLSHDAKRHALAGFSILARHSGYADAVNTGRYAVEPGKCAITIFRHLKNGLQEPMMLTIPSTRTPERLAAVLSGKLMADSASICSALKDSICCDTLGFDTATIMCMFVPNTYEVYWNTSVSQLLERMKKEHSSFWNDNREAKARSLGLTENEVSTLASIIDEETTNSEEKPMIAGMYYNRLSLRTSDYPDGMPLQADPTIKFALKDFSLRRIYRKMLQVDSPYNTYVKTGLPPGPIRIASVESIDAVLNLVRHDYLYMCAKEDFSGTHNFARTYSEHMNNARKYSQALNKRGIK